MRTDISFNNCDFKQTLNLQNKLIEKIINHENKGEILFFNITNKVITLGIRGNQNDILWTQDKLKDFEISVCPINRGGQATLHSPGQLIIYPTFDLKKINLGIRDFVEVCLQTTVLTLKDFTLTCDYDLEAPGVYTKKGKIGFIGFKFTKGIGQHGLALNINNDLSLFQSIIACGIAQPQFDKLELYSSHVDSVDVALLWQLHFFNLVKNRSTL